MLSHFQSVDGLIETTLTFPTPGPNFPVPQNMGSARNRVITEVIKDEVVALPW